MSETHYTHVSSSGALQRLDSLADALAALKSGGCLWLDFLDPTPEDLTALIEPFAIHRLSIEDCLDQNQVPKIEDFPNNTFVLFNSYTYQDNEVEIEEIDFILGKDFLITVHGHGSPTLMSFDQLEAAAKLNMHNGRHGSDTLFHLMLDYVVDQKYSTVESLQEELDQAEEVIIRDLDSFKPERLLQLRRNLLKLRKSLYHEREIMIKICRRDSPFISEPSIYHFRDIYDHLAKFFETTDSYRELIISLMEMYLSLINNRMAGIANRTNLTVRRLTMISTVFMPLTLIAGIGGMSEWSMMTGPENWKISYAVFFILMVMIGTANYFVLRRFEAKEG